MLKAIFMDFYGTVVHEDGEVIRKISQIIYDTGNVSDISKIGTYWWNEFQNAFTNSHGSHFKLQRTLEYESLRKTIQHFDSTEDAGVLSKMMFEHWVQPPIFDEAKQFFEACPLPIYLVSNIDRDDILKAVAYHGLKPKGVFTSEDAKSYKPQKELFQYALKKSGLSSKQVVHIGDSLSSDVRGASETGIKSIWINRGDREVPEGVISCKDLMEVFQTVYFKVQE